MKSIKEKTNEVFDDPFKQECFKAGANYVLECFESILPFVAKEGVIYGKKRDC